MRTIRWSLVSALLLACPSLVSFRPASGQAPPAAAVAAPAASAEEKPIRDLVDAFAKAYSAPDLNALAACLTDEADVVDSAGESTRGKAAVVRMYASSLEENPNL